MNNGYIDSHHETILLIMFEIFHNFVRNDIKILGLNYRKVSLYLNVSLYQESQNR